MEFKDIDRVNSEINMIDLKGKNYAMVPERVTAFRKLFPEGFINTEIVSNDGTTVLMQAKVGYYDQGRQVILATGFAQEIRGKGMVNGTSHIENCETSAVGRALGMIGLGINGGGICSAEELVNAITAQNQMKEEEKAMCNPPIPEGKNIQKADKVPPTVKQYISDQIKIMGEMFGINDKKKMMEKFAAMRQALIEANIIPDIPSDKQTMEQAKQMVDAMYQNFKPSDGDAA